MVVELDTSPENKIGAIIVAAGATGSATAKPFPEVSKDYCIIMSKILTDRATLTFRSGQNDHHYSSDEKVV